MKLVDILARELKEWPDQYYQIFQDSEGCVHGTLQNCDLEDCDQEDLPFDPLTVAWDGVNAIITRTEWQAAVDALNNPDAVRWDGVGLPPVGTVCEFAGGTPCPCDPFDKDLKEGMQVTIIAHFKCGDFTLAAFTFDPENEDRGMVQVEQGNYGCFRPIRTPEQIAADERQKMIADLADVIGSRNSTGDVLTAQRVHDYLSRIGYRKQEQP